MTRTRYGWMTLGGLLVLFGIVLACKLRDGSRALAQGDVPGPVLPDNKPELKKTGEPPLAPVDEVSRVLPPIGTLTPSLSSPPPPLPPGVLETRSAGLAPPPLLSVGPEPVPPIVQTGAVSSGPPAPAVTIPTPVSNDSRPILIPASATLPAAARVDPLPPALSGSSGSAAPTPPPTPDLKPDLPKPVGKPAPPPLAETTPLPPPSSLAPPPPPGPPTVKADELKVTTVPAVKVEVKDPVGEPPLAPNPGPVVQYRVVSTGETFKTLARKTLGGTERWSDIHKLNPALKPDAPLGVGTLVRLPGDACVQEEDTVKPLPPLRARVMPKVKTTLPLTGTYPITLDDKKELMLPKAILKQLGNCDTVLVSPGSDKCLWLTNQAHLDRLAYKLEKSPARESDKSGFKRLYYAQTIKVPMKDGRVAIADKLAAFAGLDQEVVLVGIDDHFEVWDAARWRRYTQAKKASTVEE